MRADDKNGGATRIFSSGFFIGLGLGLGAGLLAWMLCDHRRRDRQGAIHLPSAEGDICLRRNALCDLVRQSLKAFPGLELTDLRLAQLDHEYHLDLELTRRRRNGRRADHETVRDRIVADLRRLTGMRQELDVAVAIIPTGSA